MSESLQINQSVLRPSWRRFFIELQKDFKLLLILVLSLQIYRLYLIYTFRSAISDDVSAIDYALAWLCGLRFDGRISMLTLIPSLLTSIGCSVFAIKGFSEGVRHWTARIGLFLNCLIFAVNYVFVVEYKDNFNQWVFGAVYDDFGAVVQSAWTSYPVVRIALVASIAFWLSRRVALWFIDGPIVSEGVLERLASSLSLKVLATFVVLLVMTFSARGSIAHRPVQLKDAAVTRDSFLNRMVLNPWSALRYAIKHQRTIASVAGIDGFLAGGDMGDAVSTLFQSTSSKNIDRVMQRTATGLTANRPTHIFYIVMESMDSWPMLPQYQDMGLMPQVTALGKEGLEVKSFLSAAGGTMGSLAAILTGLPDVGVITNYQPSSQSPYGTSMAPQFKALGYETNLFYGGYLSWQRLDQFATNQGFDRRYGGNHMGDWLKGNEWGVDDGALFDFITEQLKKDTPSFNLILSTSYHPPYDIDVYAKGFSLKGIPESLKESYDGKIDLSIFGHLWYTDREVARFVRTAEKKFPGAVFAVTGDHWSRKFINERPTLYESRSVPFVLYGKKVLEGLSFPEKVAGSHLNIMPTLLDLASPEGVNYVSLADSLFDKDRRQIGFGRGMSVTPDYIVSGRMVEPLPFGVTTKAPDTDNLTRLGQAMRALGWWRIMRGSELEVSSQAIVGEASKSPQE